MNFAERKNPTTTMQYDKKIVPQVTISEQALAQMFVYTREVADEVGWLGTVYRLDNHFHINETFLFHQEVHATTTEITPEGLEKFATELLSDPEKVHLWNDIKMWGHSHVNMGITPSGQDDKQMQDFSNIGHEFFIRLICNKKGELAVDVFLYEEGLTFKNVPWTAVINENPSLVAIEAEMKKLEERANELKALANTAKTAFVTSIEEPIKAEITEKVKKFAVKTYGAYGGAHNAHSVQSAWWNTPDDVQLDDWLTESEIMYLAQTVTTRWTFEQGLKKLGVVTLPYGTITVLFNELNKLKSGGN